MADFVLVEPFVPILSQQFVHTKAAVDKSVHEGGGKVSQGRVHLACRAEPYSQYTFLGLYRIALIFRGSKFSRIAALKEFVK